MEHNINSTEDVFALLDNQVNKIDWDIFYEKRDKPAPFLLQPDLPDENLLKFLENNCSIKKALEFGCGEGRNAIYMASKGLLVTAIDSSNVSIENAKALATSKRVLVDFLCEDVFQYPFEENSVDFVYDSGLFHHLSPHRRITYINLIKRVLKPSGYFGLTCFAWGENCADEVDDWEFYEKRRTGIAFKKERLIDLFSHHFEVVEIKKYANDVPNTIQGLDFMWTCLFKKT